MKKESIPPSDCDDRMVVLHLYSAQNNAFSQSLFPGIFFDYVGNTFRLSSFNFEKHDTVLPTQDSKFEPWRSEAEHATSRSRRLPTILTNMVKKDLYALNLNMVKSSSASYGAFISSF